MWGLCGSGCESMLCRHVMPFSLYCSVLVRSSDKEGITCKLLPGLQGASSPSRSTRTLGDSIVGEGLDIIGLPSERECRRTRNWELLRCAPLDVVREMSNDDHLLFSQLQGCNNNKNNKAIFLSGWENACGVSSCGYMNKGVPGRGGSVQWSLRRCPLPGLKRLSGREMRDDVPFRWGTQKTTRHTFLRVSSSAMDVHTQSRTQMCSATCCPYSNSNYFGDSPPACRPAPAQIWSC
jgi:hypothetical protein